MLVMVDTDASQQKCSCHIQGLQDKPRVVCLPSAVLGKWLSFFVVLTCWSVVSVLGVFSQLLFVLCGLVRLNWLCPDGSANTVVARKIISMLQV